MCKLTEKRIQELRASFEQEIKYLKKENWSEQELGRLQEHLTAAERASYYLNIAKEQGFETAFALAELDKARLVWMVIKAERARQEDLEMATYVESWFDRLLSFERTKNVCRQCRKGGQDLQGSCGNPHNKRYEDTQRHDRSDFGGSTQ